MVDERWRHLIALGHFVLLQKLGRVSDVEVARVLVVLILDVQRFGANWEIGFEIVGWSPLLDKAVLDLGIDKPLFLVRSRGWVVIKFEVELETVRTLMTLVCRIDAQLVDWNLIQTGQRVVS